MTEETSLKWYVVHTYSGHESRVKTNLEERIEQYKMQDQFGEIWVPTEVVEEIKSGVRKAQTRKCFPSYILVEMAFSDETAHLVRNTLKVTGFVGNARNPVPLSPAEVERMRAMVEGEPQVRIKVEFVEGDKVKVIDGPFANFNGDVEEVKADKQRLKVLVSIFGRSTPVELDYTQVERIA
ncbi:MAG: transcription termination/antitermination factor NusG [Deltaproteobacteria bacterium]|nr:transcription termination/antitermination factor NusG [Deltaproteobacteria bacterium]